MTCPSFHGGPAHRFRAPKAKRAILTFPGTFRPGSGEPSQEPGAAPRVRRGLTAAADAAPLAPLFLGVKLTPSHERDRRMTGAMVASIALVGIIAAGPRPAATPKSPARSQRGRRA